MNFEKTNEKMGRRMARCCGNCCFVDAPENLAPVCKVNGHPINEHFTCDFFAFTGNDLQDSQWLKLNQISAEALEELAKDDQISTLNPS